MVKMMNKIIQKKQIVDAVKNIPIVAEKERWVVTLDKEEGSLFYSPKTIPNNSKLHQITDEYSVYFDKDFNPKGVMIESYGKNFIKHHKSFQKLSSEVFDDNKKISIAGSNKNKEKQSLFKALLESTLIKEIGTGMIVF